MTKSICVPSMFGSVIEIFLKEGMSSHHVHYNLFIGRASLIIGNPSAINKFKLTIGDKLFNVFFGLIPLEVPPTLKEIHFSL